MPEPFAVAFRRYWTIIITVIGLTSGWLFTFGQINAEVAKCRADIDKFAATRELYVRTFTEGQAKLEVEINHLDAEMNRMWDVVRRIERETSPRLPGGTP